jgi:hypothetical protein
MKPVLGTLARQLLAGVAIWSAVSAFAGGDPPTAGELIAKVVAARQTIGYRVRARLVRTTTATGQRETMQLLIKGRRDGEASKVLYQILWPAALAGQTLVIEKIAGRTSRIWLFTPPDKTADLTEAQAGEPFFGSDLSVEDLAEEFWSWPRQEIVGEETVGRNLCQVVDSHPDAGTKTGYLLVRTWIAADLSLPLRIEKFGKDGKFSKRITAEKITKQTNHRWTAANFIVEPADGRTRTALEGSHADRDLEIPAADFTIEKVKEGLRPKP